MKLKEGKKKKRNDNKGTHTHRTQKQEVPWYFYASRAFFFFAPPETFQLFVRFPFTAH